MTETPPELRVSAHQLQLQPGLFCLYQQARPAGAGWLPAIRLAPSPAPSPGRIAIAGLGEGGWLAPSDDAALVRVAGGPAFLLVTIYQAADGPPEPPSLQVLRLSDPAPPASPQKVDLLAHIYAQGDVPGRFGDWLGERGSRRWIEGVALALPDPLAPGDVEYQAVLGRDWFSPWAEAGQFCGSRAMSLPILGLAVRLKGAAADTHILSVCATFIDGSAAGPVTDGTPCRAETLAPLEAFQLELTPKPASRRPGRRRG